MTRKDFLAWSGESSGYPAPQHFSFSYHSLVNDLTTANPRDTVFNPGIDIGNLQTDIAEGGLHLFILGDAANQIIAGIGRKTSRASFQLRHHHDI